MEFINYSDVIGKIILYLTTEVTGTIFLTISLIMLFLFFIGILFRIEADILIALITPLAIVTAAFLSEFVFMTALIIIYLSFMSLKYLKN